MITKCLEGNPANEFHKALGGVFVEESPFEVHGIYIGMENIYYYESLSKSLEYNIDKSNGKHI